MRGEVHILVYCPIDTLQWGSAHSALALNHPERNGTDEKKDVDNILFRNRNSFRWFSLILYEFYFSDLRGPQLEQKILKLIRLTNCFIYSICFIWDFPSRKVFHLFFLQTLFFLHLSSPLRSQIQNNCPLKIIFLLFHSPLRLTNKNSKSDSCSAISGFTCVTST